MPPGLRPRKALGEAPPPAALLQQQSAKDLSDYLERLSATVRAAVGAPQESRPSLSPPVFRKQSSSPLRKSSTGTTAPASGAELLRLQKENAELLLLIAAGERALGSNPSASPNSGSLVSAVASATPSAAWLQRFVAAPAATTASTFEVSATEASTFVIDDAVAVVTNTLREAHTHAGGAAPARSLTADVLESEIDLKSQAAAPHRRSVESALKRMTDFVFSPYINFTSRSPAVGVAATQTDSLAAPGDLHYLFSPLSITGTSGVSIDLRNAVQRDSITEAMVLTAVLPSAPCAPRTSPSPAMEGPPTNRDLLEQLLQRHKGSAAPTPSASLRAGPAHIHLLERFMRTERRPLDFREGIAARLVHPDDALLSAYPCVYVPTMPVLPNDNSSARAANRMHTSWLFMCRQSMFLLTDVSDTPEQKEQDLLDSHAPEHWSFRSPPKTPEEIQRKALKKSRQRQELYQQSMGQLKDYTMLLHMAEWSTTLVTLDYSQGSVAFSNRTLKDEHPVLLDTGTTPRIDVLMALYESSRRKVEPAELGRQLYASAVLQCHRATNSKKVETIRYSLVFLSETDRSEVTSFLWAALHPGRVNSDLFSPARRAMQAYLPDALNMDERAKKDGGRSQQRIRGQDPVIAMLDAGQRPAAHMDASPFMRYSEPVVRSSHTDWYPMHAALTALEIEFCRQAHVHPITLHMIKKDVFDHPAASEWTTLGDVATLLMSHTNAEHPCLATAERVANLLSGLLVEWDLTKPQRPPGVVCEAVDVIARRP